MLAKKKSKGSITLDFESEGLKIAVCPVTPAEYQVCAKNKDDMKGVSSVCEFTAGNFKKILLLY